MKSIKNNQWISIEKQKQQGTYQNIQFVYEQYKNSHT